MQNTQNELSQARRWFWGWSCVHVFLWTFGIAWVRGGLPFDTIEGIAWGNQLQWGYSKHPPLAAWLCALFYHIAGPIGVYFLAQLAIFITFACVFRLARVILTPLQAFASVLLLEGVIYYTLISPKINPTTLMSPIWMILILILFFAITQNRLWQWLCVGIAAALTVLTKYQSPFIFAPLFGVMVLTPEGRACFKKIGPYLALGVMGICLIPHILWQVHHHWEELKYLVQSKDGERHAGFVNRGWIAHFYYPVMIVISEIGAMGGMILIVLLSFGRLSFRVGGKNKSLPSQKFAITYILFAALGPSLLTLGFSLITGSYLYPKWFTPYFSLWGVLVMLWLNPVFTPQLFKRFVCVGMSVGMLFFLGRFGYLLLNPVLKHDARPDAYFPDQAISLHVEHIWHAREGATPLPIVAGSHYLTAIVNVYGQDHPTPYMQWSTHQSPWIDDAEVNQQGAVFLWYVTHEDPAQEGLPIGIQSRFPKAQFLNVVEFSKTWPAPKNLPGVLIGFAYLPPSPMLTVKNSGELLNSEISK